MFNATKLMQLKAEGLELSVLRIVADNEPVKKHVIPGMLSASFSRNEIFNQVHDLKKRGLLDVGDVDDGFLVMLTSEGRPRYQALIEERGDTVKSVSDTDSPVKVVVATHEPEPAQEKPQGDLNQKKELESENTQKKTLTDRIMEIVESQPGLLYADIVKSLGIPSSGKEYNSVQSLVSQLDIKRGRIHRIKNGSQVRVYPGKAPNGATTEVTAPAAIPKKTKVQKPVKAPNEERGEILKLKFRVGRTSDSTIIIWGISPAPVELSVEQSNTLIDFIGGALK